ncbi:hypothetical protein AK812_SmicGene36611 [Symbiodinium microadriaticum]|uniref:Uncharacterized protein n=2 Tax=Symbiodinium TaxID=2949 RepID=A0A1Q9CIF6_SYMMI|nr:hypothetical protein AK812_SmicGene36611 [Symbiodinium microadriaticum]
MNTLFLHILTWWYGNQHNESVRRDLTSTFDFARAANVREAAWVTEFADGTMLRLSVRSGPKVKKSQITNKSELRRVANAESVCVDLAPSRNTENYELAALLSNSLQIKAEDVEFVAGGRKEKASGDRTAHIRGIAKHDLMDRLLS